ncbi:MAG TPA: hypothetical protein VFQ53_08855 [Kofleriaceae bacterium]|nr:hypothetical protein [Kofleriaceae bacterium]
MQPEPDANPPPPPDGSTVVPLDRAQSGGAPTAVTVVDGRAFVGVGPRLAIWDLAAGTLVGESAPLRGVVNAVAVVGERAYVAERTDLDAVIHVLDISNPAAPVETKVIDLAPPGGGSVINDLEPGTGVLYVADQEQGILELSLADPDAPTLTRTVTQFGVANLTVSGNRLYYWSRGFIGSTGIGALNISKGLTRIGEGSLGSSEGVAITGNLAITAGIDGIFVYDVTTIATPVQRFHLGLPDGGPFARAVTVSGRIAYIPAIDGLYILDLTTLSAIKKLGPLDLPTKGANAAAVGGSAAAIVTDRGRMIALDLTAPTAPTPQTIDVSLCADCVGIATAGSTIYAADIVGGVRSANLSDLASLGRSPEPTVTPTPDGLALVFEDVRVAGTRAYVADWMYGLRIYDTTDPAALVELGSVQTGGAPGGLAIEGDRAYIAEGTGGGFLRVVDISNPAAPAVIGSVETSKASNVKVIGTTAYVADEQLFEPGGLKIYDVSNATPVLVGKYDQDCANALDVAIDGNVAVVACAQDGFHLVDVSNPAAPARLSIVRQPDLASTWSVATWPGHAVLGHDRGIIVIDLANPAAPTELARQDTAYSVRAIDVPLPGRIVAAAGLAGVYQWQLE